MKGKNFFLLQTINSIPRRCYKLWQIMKEVIGKARKTQSLLLRKIIVNNIEIDKEKQIANEFNNFFIDVGPGLT